MAIAGDLLTVEYDGARPQVDAQPTDGEDAGLAAHLDATQKRSDAGFELGAGIGLDDVLVGTRVEEADNVGLVVAGRGHDDRHVRDRTDHPHQVLAVDIGQTEVEYDQIRSVVDDRLQARHRHRLRSHHMTGRRQCPDREVADLVVVLDHQDGCHG